MLGRLYVAGRQLGYAMVRRIYVASRKPGTHLDPWVAQISRRGRRCALYGVTEDSTPTLRLLCFPTRTTLAPEVRRPVFKRRAFAAITEPKSVPAAA